MLRTIRLWKPPFLVVPTDMISSNMTELFAVKGLDLQARRSVKQRSSNVLLKCAVYGS